MYIDQIHNRCYGGKQGIITTTRRCARPHITFNFIFQGRGAYNIPMMMEKKLM